jgi:hypothetical protein
VAKDLFEHRGVRLTLIVAIPAAIFILVSAGIRVSTYGIDHTVIVLGQRELVSGWPAAMRISLLSDDERFFLPSRLTGHLVRGDRRQKLFGGPVQDSGYALARNFRVPEMGPGPAELELEIHFDDRRRIVRAEVQIVDRPPKEKLTVPSDSEEDWLPGEVVRDGNRFQLFTEDRGAPTGLASLLFIRGQSSDGSPVATEVPVLLPVTQGDKQPEKTVVRTDRSGIFAMLVKPMELAFPITVLGVRRPGEDGRAILRPRVVYAGIVALVHNPLVRDGERLRIAARQISSGGPVYADVFVEGRWVHAQSAWFGGKGAHLEIDPPVTGMGRVQLTTSAFMPGPAVAVRHFYSLDDKEDMSDGLRKILNELSLSSESDRKWAEALLRMEHNREGSFDRIQAAAFALARLYKGHHKVPTLISSRRDDDKELGAFKTRFQRLIMLAIIALGFGVALLIVLMALQARRRDQRMARMILAEDESGKADSEYTDTAVGTPAEARCNALFQGVVLFLIILGAFIAIAVLVDTMTWMH